MGYLVHGGSGRMDVAAGVGRVCGRASIVDRAVFNGYGIRWVWWCGWSWQDKVGRSGCGSWTGIVMMLFVVVFCSLRRGRE